MFWRSPSLVGTLLLLAWCAGASASGSGVAGPGTYVATVDVSQNDAEAPAGLADALRDAVLKEAASYGDAGTPIAVKIEIDRVHFKNPAAAMLIGDDNRTEGRVRIVDPASGTELGSFSVEVDSSKPEDMAAEIGLDVAGAFDPTGAVDVAHMAGDAGSANIDRAGTTNRMITNFAEEALRRTFGDARARAARSTR